MPYNYLFINNTHLDLSVCYKTEPDRAKQSQKYKDNVIIVYEGDGCEEGQDGKSNGCGGRPELASCKPPQRDI